MTEMTDKELAAIHAYGTTHAHTVTVKMKSEHYAIFHWPGSYWSDNGGRHYGQATYVLQLKGDRHYGSGSRPVQEWEGRVSKKLLAEALALAEAKYMEAPK